MSKSAGYLPGEMIRDILLRLPVKSLLRCKSVCKPWLSTISNPDFIKSQLHRAIIASKNNPTLLEIEDPQEEEPELDSDPDEDYLLEIEQEEQLRHQLLFEALLAINAQHSSTYPVCIQSIAKPSLFSAKHPVIGSCYNGILCVTDGLSNLYLWNPSIRQCKKLPPPKPCADSVCMVDFGFGYDSISDDYKVFRVLYDLVFDVVVPILQVYSSNSDSWNEFWPFTGEDLVRYLGHTIVINGILYFSTVNKLVSFDLRQHVFVFVPFPSSTQRMISNVLDFKGSVAMVFESGSQVDLWTLDDVFGKASWTKMFSLEPDFKLNMFLCCYLGAGQFYGSKSINGMFLYNFMYDYEKNVIKYYRLGDDRVFPAYNYIETLVSLDRFEQVE